MNGLMWLRMDQVQEEGHMDAEGWCPSSRQSHPHRIHSPLALGEHKAWERADAASRRDRQTQLLVAQAKGSTRLVSEQIIFPFELNVSTFNLYYFYYNAMGIVEKVLSDQLLLYCRPDSRLDTD
jgi:hypothetical protein